MLSKCWWVVLVSVGCSEHAPPVVADAAILVDARVCRTPTGAGIVHNTNLAAAETWTEVDSPHIIMFDTTISATITVEPCAVVRIAGGKTVTVAAGGSFNFGGDSGFPITVERLDPATAFGPIRGLTDSGVRFAHTVVRGGGNPLGPVSNGAAIMTQSNVQITALEIADSASQGLSLGPTARVTFAAGPNELVVHGSVGFPVMTAPNAVGQIPTGTYTGNGIDEILITNVGQVTTSQTIHAYGVPYRVGTSANDQLDVLGPVSTVAVLTIEPGVTMKFQPGGRMRIDTAATTSLAKAALIAVGTPTQKIVFTSVSSTPAAGDWVGISFAATTSPMSRMQYARVAFAGGPTATGSNSCPYPTRVGQNDAAIRIFGTPGPLTQFITDTEILASGLDGIDRGWRDDLQNDFIATNTFTTIGGCKQSTPKMSNGGCPATPPCP